MRQMEHPPIPVIRLPLFSNYEIGHLADLAVASEPARRAGRFELGVPRRKEGWVKPIASMPQISRVSEGWTYDAFPAIARAG